MTENATADAVRTLVAEENLAPTTRLSSKKMRATTGQVALWLALYITLSLTPLVLLGALSPPKERDFWTELGVGLGVVGFAMLALQFASTARFRRIAPFFGSDTVLLFHRIAGIVAFVFVMAHPLILFFTDPRSLEYLDPRVNALRAIFLAAAILALLALAALPSFRERIGLSYEWWRLSHAVAGAGVIFVGLAHGLQVGHYVAGVWKQALWVLIAGSAIALVVYTRVVKPLLLRRRPYRVAEVRKQVEATTLVLAPEGHAGMEFRPGQFAWLTLGDSPLSLGEHPFSLSSEPRADGTCDVTIAALGDFSSTVADVEPGTRAFLDGPHGSFTLGAQPMHGAVLIMGGIGITPAMSMLRACRAAGDRRPIVLIYANRSLETTTFKRELEELESEINLRVVHVLEEPPEDWEGERGFVSDDVLERHLPRGSRDWHYFVCGPPKMMDLVEKALAARGVPVWNRSIERFSFA
jgi:predicted ferric reductase